MPHISILRCGHRAKHVPISFPSVKSVILSEVEEPALSEAEGTPKRSAPPLLFKPLSPKCRVPHLRDSFSVAKVGIVQTGVPDERFLLVGVESTTALLTIVKHSTHPLTYN